MKPTDTIKKSKVFLVLCLLFAIISGPLIYFSSKDYHIEEVDCFDNKHNKINGLTCDNKVSNKTPLHFWSMAFTILMATSGLVAFKYMLDEIYGY